MIRFFRLFLRLVLFALWTLALVPFQLIILLFSKDDVAYILPRLWHRGVLKIANTQIILTGNIPLTGKNFYIGNHISSMDIPILGAHLIASFVAKADVARYPLFGFLARVQQTLFISRNPAHAEKAIAKIRQTLLANRSIILFPEGTSTDASYIAPFKSSLFTLPIEFAHDRVSIVPFTLQLISVEGSTDLTRARRNQFTLSPDVEFWQNFFSIMGLNEAVVRLHFHPPLAMTEGINRKILAAQAHDIVSAPLPPLLPSKY